MLLNVPNIFAYIRIILCTAMIYLLPHRPILSFILTFTSGLVDMIDGRVARYFHQTSKLGLLFDLSIDRLTNLAQFFHLSRIYPKYCNVFLIAGFFEIIRDVIFWTGSSYDTMMNIFEYIHTNRGFVAFQNLKQDIDQIVLFNKKPRYYDQLNSNGVLVQDYLVPCIWYGSDLFYWIIYIDGFYKLQQSNKQRAVNDDSIGLESPNSSISFNDLSKSEEPLLPYSLNQRQPKNFNHINLMYFVYNFVEIGDKVVRYFNLKTKSYIQNISYCIGFFLMSCAFLKSAHTLREAFLVTVYIVKIDYKAIDYVTRMNSSHAI
jgi:hypothetical protein